MFFFNFTVPTGPANNVTATVISSEQVYLTWKDPDITDHNGVITHYEIDLTVVSTGQRLHMTSTDSNFLLDSLLPFTTYTCRVAASTAVGNGPYSMPISFQTAEAGKSACGFDT